MAAGNGAKPSIRTWSLSVEKRGGKSKSGKNQRRRGNTGGALYVSKTPHILASLPAEIDRIRERHGLYEKACTYVSTRLKKWGVTYPEVVAAWLCREWRPTGRGTPASWVRFQRDLEELEAPKAEYFKFLQGGINDISDRPESLTGEPE